MQLAIHNSSFSFHCRWIAYCKENGIPFKLVNCYSNDIIEQLVNCDALMWHHSQNNPKDVLFAQKLLFSVEQAGKKVFPNFNTAWHFDDKVGQKYLLEAINVPMVPSYVFYDKKEALNWAKIAAFPKVFKLRGGAGSSNVKLVESYSQAVELITRAFGKGFKSFDGYGNFNEVIRKFKLRKTTGLDLLKSSVRLFYPPAFARIMGREIGYVYFQDFIPNNDHDIRVIVIGDKAFAIKRMVRKNDFRASGSGNILYNKYYFNDNDIQLAFEIHNKINSQCTAIDIIHDNGEPKVVEISYGFSPEGYDPCIGYWDKKLNWYEGKFNPYGWMVEEVTTSRNKS